MRSVRMLFCLLCLFLEGWDQKKHLTEMEGGQRKGWGSSGEASSPYSNLPLDCMGCSCLGPGHNCGSYVAAISETSNCPNVLQNCQQVCSPPSSCESALHPACRAASKSASSSSVSVCRARVYQFYAWLINFTMQITWSLRDIWCTWC